MYEKSEISWLTVVICSIALGHINYSYFSGHDEHPMPLQLFLLLNGIISTIVLLFYKLTVKVGDNKIQALYGIGLLRFNIRPQVIKEIEVVKTPWYYGLGIRITPQGMLYNAHTFKAVKIVFEDSKPKTVFIGSPEPERLKEAILRHFNSDLL